MDGKTTDGLTRLEKWPSYAVGLLVETGFILGLTLVALGIALLADAVF